MLATWYGDEFSHCVADCISCLHGCFVAARLVIASCKHSDWNFTNRIKWYQVSSGIPILIIFIPLLKPAQHMLLSAINFAFDRHRLCISITRCVITYILRESLTDKVELVPPGHRIRLRAAQVVNVVIPKLKDAIRIDRIVDVIV